MKLPTSILTQIITFFEWVLAIIIIMAVMAEGTMLIMELYTYISDWQIAEKFQTFLSNALLYIIGLEVALMLIKRDAILIIDIMIYAVARKIIIQNVSVWEILIGVVAIILLYFLKNYGVKKQST
ncbi:membrane hypothetical protein [[Clostridium] ultunense Esp]|nr:membrane hypothetical protein [[Clostridium] ultunense Esp]